MTHLIISISLPDTVIQDSKTRYLPVVGFINLGFFGNDSEAVRFRGLFVAVSSSNSASFGLHKTPKSVTSKFTFYLNYSFLKLFIQKLLFWKCPLEEDFPRNSSDLATFPTFRYILEMFDVRLNENQTVWRKTTSTRL